MKNNFILLVIVLFSLVIRLVNLGSNPVILNRDEAAIGYNAFLLSETGKDEWGRSWPLTLESFGDYKLLGYPLLVANLFNFLPENDFVVRLPSALFGALLISALYLVTIRVTKNKKTAEWAAVLAAVTPIFFFYSRIAFEANVALFFFVMYVYFVLRPVDKKTFVFDLLGLACILFSVITYNTPLLLLPFIVLIIPFARGLKNWRSWIFLTTSSLLIVTAFFSLFASLTAQKQGITIFADSATTLAYAEYRESFSGVLKTVVGNKYLYYFKIMIHNFMQSFSPQFLITRGGEHPWHALPGWGHVLLPTYLAALVGIFLCFKNIFYNFRLFTFKKLSSISLLESKIGRSVILLYLLIISLAPSVITIDSPHATRSLFFIVVLVMISAVCIQKITESAKYQKYIQLIVLVGCMTLFINYLHEYFLKYPTQQTEILQTNFDTQIQAVNTQYPTEKIAVVDTAGFHYILLAWYLKVPADEFFSTIVKQDPDRIGFRYGQQVGRYHFVAKPLDRSQDEKYVVEWSENTWKVSE